MEAKASKVPSSARSSKVHQLSAADLRHALRHTCGHLLWLAHKDLKMVQKQLGHEGLEMAGHYSEIEDAESARISEAIPVDLRGSLPQK